MQNSRFVSDLLWVVNSPPLVHSSWRPNLVLSREDIDVRQLASFLSLRTSHRVGHYFEDLVRYYLIHHAGVDHLRCGVPIRDENRTIGELDFVYRDATSRWVHLETAVKFYLYRDSGDWLDSHYVGPNAKDTLEKKIRLLREHQMPLSDHPLARQEIVGDRDERIETKDWICGRIFYHPRDDKPKFPSPLLSAEHLRGLWIRASELDWFDQTPATTVFQVQRKPYWLSGGSPQDDGCPPIAMRERLREHFCHSGHPVMIASNGLDSELAVNHTITMVVSDAWPLLK